MVVKPNVNMPRVRSLENREDNRPLNNLPAYPPQQLGNYGNGNKIGRICKKKIIFAKNQVLSER